MDDPLGLQAALGVAFESPARLRQALVHRSYINESELPDAESNERLEFLGDAVLGLVIAAELFHRFPERPEGDLTTMRSRLVRGATLGMVGARLDLGRYLILGKGEEQSGGRTRPANIGRGLEAIIGAVYLDGGLERARAVILRLFQPEIGVLERREPSLDPKSRLQQLGQSAHGVTPHYVTVAAEGPDHAREFTVEVRFGETVLGTGSGMSKRLAQQAAAFAALQALRPAEPGEDRENIEGKW